MFHTTLRSGSGLDAAQLLNYSSGVLIRSRYQWVLLLLAALQLTTAFLTLLLHEDHFMDLFNVACAIILLLFWKTSYTTLANGALTKRVFLIPYRAFRVDEIETVRPHPKNGKLGYGTVIELYTRAGKNLTLQPNNPAPFLASLREQAPSAKFSL
jgi:hypothetical protein